MSEKNSLRFIKDKAEKMDIKSFSEHKDPALVWMKC